MVLKNLENVRMAFAIKADAEKKIDFAKMMGCRMRIVEGRLYGNGNTLTIWIVEVV